MMIRRSVLWMLLISCLCLPGIAHATGLNADGTAVEVRIESMRYDVTVRGQYVSAVMETRFWADSGEDHAANLRFPLPPGAVIHRAEIYIPEQDRWEVAETMGRREGQGHFDNPQIPDTQRLLVQRIGVGFYRARVFPVENAARLMLRIYYAHMLERVDGDHVLRIAQASHDVDPATPKNALQIFVDAGAGQWTQGTFSESSGTFLPGSGRGQVGIADKPLSEDIELRLTPAEPLGNVEALRYQPTAEGLLDHSHASWVPDLSAYPDVQTTSRNVVIVLDSSGSMGGAKIEEAKNAVMVALGELSGDDQFGLISFSNAPDPWRSSMADVVDVNQAMSWVSGVQSGGSTAMASALENAVAVGLTSDHPERPIDIFLITDGNPTDGPTTAQGMVSLIEAGLPAGRDIRIFGCGIGYDLSQDLINGMSASTGGESVFALDDAAITGQVLDLFGRIRSGGVTGVELSVTSASAADSFSLSRLFPGDVLSIGTMMDAPTLLHLEGTSPAGSDVTVSVAFPSGLTHAPPFNRIAAPLVAKTWADDLEYQIDYFMETDERVDQAVVLAKTYGIVSRYSSLLAFSTPEAYTEAGIDRIARDEAGIALEPVPSSLQDEDRLGGEGLNDSPGSASDGYCEQSPGDPSCSSEDEAPYDAPNENAQANGCACSSPGRAASPHALWLLLGIALLRRRRS